VPLRYTGLRVTDLDRSLAFYGKLLGLREVSRGDGLGMGIGRWVLLEDPHAHQRLELNWYPEGSKFATPYAPGDGLDHVGFLLGPVPRGRLEREYRRLLAGGARPTGMTPASSDGWIAYVTDPDGNWIEIFRWPTAAERRAAAKAKRAAAAGSRPPRARRRPAKRRRR
jgi:catechol 2,3-dioxygenase-like lactoylglutathione lyase family enzyme